MTTSVILAISIPMIAAVSREEGFDSFNESAVEELAAEDCRISSARS